MKRTLFSLLLIGAFVLVLASSVLASPQQYSLDWWTVDAGGGVSQGGSFRLSGAVGQPDAGALYGGSYNLYGGFWTGASADQQFKIMLPLVIR